MDELSQEEICDNLSVAKNSSKRKFIIISSVVLLLLLTIFCLYLSSCSSKAYDINGRKFTKDSIYIEWADDVTEEQKTEYLLANNYSDETKMFNIKNSILKLEVISFKYDMSFVSDFVIITGPSSEVTQRYFTFEDNVIRIYEQKTADGYDSFLGEGYIKDYKLYLEEPFEPDGLFKIVYKLMQKNI